MLSTLSLTFDDGPDELWTKRVLGMLGRCRTRATFFMIGERVQRYGSTARAVVEAGHDVQLHCHRHLRHTELSESEIEQDTQTALEEFRQIDVYPACWRTPWGVCTPATRSVAARHGLRLVHWTIDTHDWRGDSAYAMLANACAGLTNGGVVLMHDALGPGAQRAGCQNTIKLLPRLIGAIQAEGLIAGPLHEDGRETDRWLPNHRAGSDRL